MEGRTDGGEDGWRGGRTQSPHLFVNLCKLFQVVLKKGNFLLLRSASTTIIAVEFNALHRESQRSARQKLKRKLRAFMNLSFPKAEKSSRAPN